MADALSDNFIIEEGLFRCTPKTQEAAEAVKFLAVAVDKANARLKQGLEIAADAITARTVLAAQEVVLKLSPWAFPPEMVRKGLSVAGSPLDMVKRTAATCPAIANYIESVLTLFPQALNVPPPPPPQAAPQEQAPVAGASVFKKVSGTSIAVAAAGLATAGYLAYRANKRHADQFIDRSDEILRMAGMPESDNESEESNEPEESDGDEEAED